jgi:dTDP-6-deoxy-L-talose 4-dehydrogenase (NAD+)
MSERRTIEKVFPSRDQVPDAERRVIVTGATGFLGSKVIPLLLSNNNKVLVIGRCHQRVMDKAWSGDVEFMQFDMNKSIPKLEIDIDTSLIHLAWDGLPNFSSMHHIETNLPNSYRLIRDLVSMGVHRVTVAGSCAEFGNQNGELSSMDATFPSNAYALAKDFLRKSLTELQNSLPFELVWGRLFYLYGEGQSPYSILPMLDAAVAQGMNAFRMSSGTQLRDYLPVETAAQMLVDLHVGNLQGPFNVSSGIPISILTLVENRLKETGAKIHLELGAFPDSESEPTAFWGLPL